MYFCAVIFAKLHSLPSGVYIVLYSHCHRQVQTYGAGLQEQNIVCYIAIMFGTQIERYDGYNLTRIDPDNGCYITDAAWYAMKAEAASYEAALIFEGYILVRTDY